MPVMVGSVMTDYLLGRVMQERRAEMGNMSQLELALRAGDMTQSDISKIEHGKWIPSDDVLRRIANALEYDFFILVLARSGVDARPAREEDFTEDVTRIRSVNLSGKEIGFVPVPTTWLGRRAHTDCFIYEAHDDRLASIGITNGMRILFGPLDDEQPGDRFAVMPVRDGLDIIVWGTRPHDVPTAVELARWKLPSARP